MGFDGATLAERATALRKDRAFQGLTVKQEAYCLARFNGADPSEAYRAAFNPPRSAAHTIASDASNLEARQDIVERIAQLVERRDRQTTLAPKVTREWILNGVAEIASHPSEKTSDRLKAYEMLGKSAGIDLFRDTVVTVRKERTPEDVAKELRDRLEALRPVIEGTSHQVAEIPPGVEPEGPRVQRKRKPITT